jgi:hypothetical protein
VQDIHNRKRQNLPLWRSAFGDRNLSRQGLPSLSKVMATDGNRWQLSTGYCAFALIAVAQVAGKLPSLLGAMATYKLLKVMGLYSKLPPCHQNRDLSLTRLCSDIALQPQYIPQYIGGPRK